MSTGSSRPGRSRSPTSPPNPRPKSGRPAATLHGVVNPDGIATTDCGFKYGIDDNYNLTAPCEIGGVPTTVISGSADVAVSAPVIGTGEGLDLSLPADREELERSPLAEQRHRLHRSDAPSAGNEFASSINTDSAQLNADVDPPAAPPATTSNGDGSRGLRPHRAGPRRRAHHQRRDPAGQHHRQGTRRRDHLPLPGRRHNDAGSFTGGDNEFTTFAPTAVNDPCANAHVRQQTSAACCSTAAPTSWSPPRTPAATTSSRTWSRAEAVRRLPASREQGPLRDPQRRDPGALEPDQPRRRSLRRDPRRGRLDDRIRRASPPTTRAGPAGRSPRRWRGADEGLSTFAFGGAGICDPCFADGSVNVPLRMPDGELIQGMAGSLEPGAGAEPARIVASASPPTARTSSSARPRNSRPTPTRTDRHDDLRPRSRRRHDPGRLQAPERRTTIANGIGSRRARTSPTTARGS